jgi:hypothetical protein
MGTKYFVEPDDRHKTYKKEVKMSDIYVNMKVNLTGFAPDKDGIFYDNRVGKWIAFDNRSGECFVEEFESEMMVYDWIM